MAASDAQENKGTSGWYILYRRFVSDPQSRVKQGTDWWLASNRVTVISIYRIPQLNAVATHSYDPTWIDVEPQIWSIIEVAVAILGACAITYRPLLRWISRHWITRVQSVSSGRTPRRCLIKPSNAANNRPVFKHPLSLSLLSVPSSVYNSPSKRECISSC